MKGLRKTKERVLGFALALVMIVSVFTSVNMFEVKAETPSETLIESVTIEFDWSKLSSFNIGASIPNIEDYLVSVTADGLSEEKCSFGLQIKATEEHVTAGYITQDDYLNAENGWVSAEQYSTNYKVNENDIYGYAFDIHCDFFYYCFDLGDGADIKERVNIINTNIVVDKAYAYGYYNYNDVAEIYLNLGTGADIEESINPSTQEPVTPPTTDDDNEPVTPPTTDSDEIVFTDETADTILRDNTIIVNSKCEKVWVSTEEDPYAYPARVITNEDGSKGYELVGSDDAETYIRIDFTYTLLDGTELTWLENYTDAEHPNSMYDVSYPIVLKDAEGNIYVKESTYGMPEGSFDEQIGVVPKEIYDGYMDWLINKLKGEVSDTTTNDHKAQLESEPDVKTKVELTEDDKSAIANGEELEVVLVFTDAGTKIDNDEKKAIEKQLGTNKLGTFLDIELIKKIGSTEVEVSETTGLITITFEMPEELKNKDNSVVRTYKVMRYHEGKVDILDAKYDAKTGKLSFETDKFSTYAIVYSDAKANNTTTSTLAPQTGDSSNTVLYVTMLCVAMFAVIMTVKKQGLRNN